MSKLKYVEAFYKYEEKARNNCLNVNVSVAIRHSYLIFLVTIFYIFSGGTVSQIFYVWPHFYLMECTNYFGNKLTGIGHLCNAWTFIQKGGKRNSLFLPIILHSTAHLVTCPAFPLILPQTLIPTGPCFEMAKNFSDSTAKIRRSPLKTHGQ